MNGPSQRASAGRFPRALFPDGSAVVEVARDCLLQLRFKRFVRVLEKWMFEQFVARPAIERLVYNGLPDEIERGFVHTGETRLERLEIVRLGQFDAHVESILSEELLLS